VGLESEIAAGAPAAALRKETATLPRARHSPREVRLLFFTNRFRAFGASKVRVGPAGDRVRTSPIDAFVLSKFAREELSFQPTADRPDNSSPASLDCWGYPPRKRRSIPSAPRGTRRPGRLEKRSKKDG